MRKIAIGAMIYALICLYITNVLGSYIDPRFTQTSDSFYDPRYDYSVFWGRVTDKDTKSKVFKIESETKNSKYLKVGDLLEFVVSESKINDQCKGFVRDTEGDYFIIYVSDLYPCTKSHDYFRRGMILKFFSKTLEQRVADASVYRDTLIKRKSDFFMQLNQINHFLDSFEQQKVLLAASYDAEILKLQKKKQNMLDDIFVRKDEKIKLQKDLSKKISELDGEIEFYRIKKEDHEVNRWHLDHDLGLPVGNRPQEMVDVGEDDKSKSVIDYRGRKIPR